MLITIYDSTGTPKADLSPDDSSTQVKEVQGDSILTLSFTHYDHIALDVDDYVDFEGERFWLTEKYRPRQNARMEWIYDIKLYGVESMLKRLLVIKTVYNEDDPVFTLTAPPREHVAMIVKCMNDGMGNITDWKVGTVNGTENIVIDYFGKYCDEALKEIAEKVGAEWWVEGQTVNICKCEHGEPLPMGYNKGLLSIDPGTADNVKFYTRLYPVGSSRNIDREKYGYSRLQLPGGQKYVEINADKYGRVDHYEADAFADIYPRRTGIVSNVRSEEKTGEDGKPFTIFYFKDNSLPFDPNAYEIGGLVKRVSFQEGSELAGLGEEDNGTYFFEVNFNSTTREFEIITIWPYDNDMQLPGDKLIPKIGDKYILWNLRMPDEYYELAEAEFLAAVEQYNADHTLDISVYKAPTDHVWIEDNEVELTIGRRIRLESDEYFPEKGYRDSRITRITRKVNLPSSMDIEISDALSRTAQEKISDSISEVRSYAEGIAGSIALPDIIRTGDSTRPTDNNILSAKRTYADLLGRDKDERTSGKLSSDKGFEVGNYMAGVSGGMLGVDPEGDSFAEVARLYVRVKAFFEELTVVRSSVLAGKQYITPGGGIKCVKVEETSTGYRCYFLSEQDGEKTYTKIIPQDQAICQEFTVEPGTSQKVSNHYFWRLVTDVNNDAVTEEDTGNHYGYIELSKSVCDNDSDVPKEGDEICQFGYRGTGNRERQTAMVFSTVDADAPSMKLFSGIDSFSLNDKSVISFGRDPVTGQVYFRLGKSTAKQYLEYTQDGGLVVAGSISTQSTYGDEQLGDYIENAAQSAADIAKAELQGKIDELQNQIDGVVETWNGSVDPSKSNHPASEWTTDLDRQAHIGDVYFNIGAYNASSNPNAGHAWRWFYNSSSDYGWIEIADSDAVRALQLAQMSVLDTDVLYRQTESQTDAPATPLVNASGTITDLKGWSTDAPEWEADKYIWQTTYVKKGDGGASFSNPTCISGRNGVDGTPAKLVVVNADSTAFVYKDDFATLVGPQEIGLSATLQGTSGYQWSYRRQGETEFKNFQKGTSQTLDIVPAQMSTLFPGDSRSVLVRCTSGGVYDEVTLVKVSSGSQGVKGDDAYTVLLSNESHIFEGDTEKAVAASTESSVIAYKGATQVAATIGTIAGMPSGMTVAISNNGTAAAKFTVNVTTALTTKQGTLNVPVTVDGKTFTQVFSWSLSLKGKDGRGISSVEEQYAIHSSGTTAPADSEFSDGVKTMTDQRPYLWNREITTYTDNTSKTTLAVCIGVKGQNGDPGATVVSVTNYYLASSKASGVKTTDTGWVTDASHANATTDATKPYLWNYEVTKWSKGSDTKTAPHVVGKFGKDGVSPRITEQYFLSTSSTQLLGGSWKDTKPTWVAGCYYWTRSKIDYGNGDVEYTEGICVTPENGTSVLAEYSADGTNWHPAYQAGDVWMHTGTDGQNWSPAIKIVGSDGTNGSNYSNNLMLSTEQRIERTFTAQGDHYEKISECAVKLETGKTYTISGMTNGVFTDKHQKYGFSYVVLWIVGGAVNQIVSGDDMTNDGSKGHTFKWNNPSGVYYLRVNFYDAGTWWVEKIKVEEGSAKNPQWTPAPSEMIGQDGQYRKFQWAKNNSTTTAPTSGWEDAPMTAPAGEYVWMRSRIVTPPDTAPTTWETATRITGDKGQKGDPGDPGSPTYMLDLTDEVKGIACDASGTPLSTSIPTSQAQVWKGSQKVAHSSATYSIAQATGVTASVNNSTGVVSLSNLTADTASVVVQAVVDGVTLQSTISLYKIKPGAAYSDNLILNSNFSREALEWIGWGSPALREIVTLDGRKWAHVKTSATHWQGYSQKRTNVVKPNTQYTLSFLIKSVRSERLSVMFHWNDASFSILSQSTTYYDVNTTAQRIVIKMTSPGNASCNSFNLMIGNGNDAVATEVWFTDVKLEEGSNPNPQWTPNAIDLLGETGYSVVASVSRPNFTEAQWATYGTTGHVENWINTESIRNGCRIGDYFRVYGTATDSGKSHVAVYRSDTASGTLHGVCVAHEIADSGEAAVTYQLEPSVDNITRSMTGKLSVNSVTCSVYKTTGDSTRVLTSEKQVRFQVIKKDGSNTEHKLWPTNGVTGAVAVTEDTESIICELLDGNTVLDRERVPVLSDASDLEASSRNLLLNSMEFTVGSASSANNWQFQSFDIPVPLKKGDFLALMVEEIKNLAGASTEFTVSCYDAGINNNIGGGDKQMTAANRTAIFEITADEAKPKFLFYAGKKTATANKSVRYTKAMLVKGNVPMQTWVEAPEDTGAGVNLLRNSRARYSKTYSSGGDHYNLLKRLTVYLENGKTYTISGRTNCTSFSNSHAANDYSNRCVLWLCSTADSPQGTVNTIVSGPDMTTDGTRGHTFVWNNPTGEYFLRVNFYATGTFWVEKVKIEKGSCATDWTPSPDDVEYLEEALKENTKIEGGLILASTVSLGKNNTDFTSQTTWSGINGIYVDNAIGGGIAAWYGGDMIDLAQYYNWNASKGTWVQKDSSLQLAVRIAKGIDRMDGSGYRAGGNFWWDTEGDTNFVGNIFAKGVFAGQVSVGDEGGQRIDLDPVKKAMEVFDSSGSCVATHSGRVITLAEAVPSAASGTGSSRAINFGTQSFISNSMGLYTHTYPFEMAVTTSGKGVLKVTVPAMTITAKTLASGSGATDSNATVTVQPILRFYNGNELVSKHGMQPYTTNGMGGGTVNRSANTIYESRKATRVVLDIECTAKNSAALYGQVTITASGNMTSEFVAQWYRCEYGANGWVISYDSQNYAYLLIEGGKLHFKVVSNNKTVISS